MKTAEWSDHLLLGFEPMDAVNREFMKLLARAQEARDGAIANSWQMLIEHTESHFAREDQWMRQSNFATADDHMLQHRVVLKVMREALVCARDGQHAAVREMANELASWFVKHAQSLDAALALHMRREPALTAR